MVATRRLNINLPAETAANLEKLASDSGRTMTELIRNAIGLIQVAQEAKSNQQKLIIADANDKPLKEIIMI